MSKKILTAGSRYNEHTDKHHPVIIATDEQGYDVTKMSTEGRDYQTAQQIAQDTARKVARANADFTLSPDIPARKKQVPSYTYRPANFKAIDSRGASRLAVVLAVVFSVLCVAGYAWASCVMSMACRAAWRLTGGG